MEIMIHPRVQKYINESGEKKRIIKNLKKLAEDPFNARSGVDIKKLKGKWDSFLRIRKGNIRIILKVYKKEKQVFIERVDFRGNVY